jgi:hypothetical protein
MRLKYLLQDKNSQEGLFLNGCWIIMLIKHYGFMSMKNSDSDIL